MTETPVLGNVLDDGKIGAEHADAAGAALRELEGEQRKQLAKRIDALVDLASSSTPEEFARRVREESRRVTDDEGEGRLARQQCAVRFNHRVDPATGMIEFWGRFDPLRGVPFVNRLKARMAELFAKEVPAGCPTDPLEKNAYLQALALLDLCEGKGGRSGRPEVVVVVDVRDRPDRRWPIVDWGIPVELPIRVLTELVPDADVHTVVVRGGDRAPRARQPGSRPNDTPGQRGATKGPPSDAPHMRSARLSGAVQSLQDPPRRVVATRRTHRPRQPPPGVHAPPHRHPRRLGGAVDR